MAKTMTVDFLAKTRGLEVKLRDLSSGLPNPETLGYEWDFGDGSPFSYEQNPTHKYEELGEYTITFKVYQDDTYTELLGSSSKFVRVSNKVRTVLSDTIYKLIDTYIPTDVFGEVPVSTKQQLIEKWQLYLQPLVDHCVPVCEYNNELFYEALENQLIMELAAYDYLILKVQSIIGYSATKVVKKQTTEGEQPPKEVISDKIYKLEPGDEPGTYVRGDLIEEQNEREIDPWCRVVSYTITRDTEMMTETEIPVVECVDPKDYYTGPDTAGGSVKKIVTGPTEVEYFDQDAQDSDLVSYAYNALKPGGLIDTLKQNLCMLAERVRVFLPICPPQPKVVVPRVVNRRKPGPLSGPDPYGIIR